MPIVPCCYHERNSDSNNGFIVWTHCFVWRQTNSFLFIVESLPITRHNLLCVPGRVKWCVAFRIWQFPQDFVCNPPLIQWLLGIASLVSRASTDSECRPLPSPCVCLVDRSFGHLPSTSDLDLSITRRFSTVKNSLDNVGQEPERVTSNRHLRNFSPSNQS
jgi:hypothetical protein